MSSFETARAMAQMLIRDEGQRVVLTREIIADAVDRVSTEDARAMALRLAREEGIFAGTSTGANVVAALRLAKELGPDATIVTIMCDTGMKYLQGFRTTFTSGPRVRTTPQ